MEKVLKNPDDTKAIANFIAKEFSWYSLYFTKLSVWQKIFLLFLDFFGALLPIYGTFQLFTNHSWALFITFGILFMATYGLLYLFTERCVKQIFEKTYRSPVCSSINQYKLDKLSSFLGEYNTNENLVDWLTHFREKAAKELKKRQGKGSIIGGSVAFILIGLGHLHIESNVYLAIYIAVPILAFGLMTF
ncbi:MAG: hypothetical protein LBV39_07200, partial [Bacteroidales bacterium]|nr:hypothetical protein [Bacteroidales bacterium]